MGRGTPRRGRPLRPTSSPLGQTLRRLRLERGLTQGELGGRDLGVGHVSDLERGESDPSLSAVRALAARLQVHPAVLMTESLRDEVEAAHALLLDAANHAPAPLRLVLLEAAGRIVRALEGQR